MARDATDHGLRVARVLIRWPATWHVPANWRAALALALVAILARAQTFGNPVIGFDEQFYLLVGDRMWHGAVPYVDIFDRKPIGLFVVYAAIRALGGEGFWQYQLVATAVVALTAFAIYRAACKLGDKSGALIAACLYIIWLDFLEGEGGQAELFFNLSMVGAALLTWRAVETQRHVGRRGGAATALVGIALQIKYTTVFEGIFFGLALMWAQWRASRRGAALVCRAALWIAIALAPTLLALLSYAYHGALLAYVFATFQSNFGRLADPVAAQSNGLAEAIGILSPLLVCAGLGLRRARPGVSFVGLWLGAAVLGYLGFKSFLTLHYAIPVLVPATIAAAPLFAQVARRRILPWLFLALAFVASQIAIARTTYIKGGRDTARALAAAAQPHHGCIFVYDGYPALYMLTHSCLPTRWPFPGHLDSSNEASARAIGVDPRAELRRILATRPEVIIDTAPVYYLANQANHDAIEAVLARDYRLTARVKTESDRYRLVYRLREAR